MTATETKEWLDQLPEADRKKAMAVIKAAMETAQYFGNEMGYTPDVLEDPANVICRNFAFRALTEHES